MRIRTKLIATLCGFAVFAVLAASATIYAVHWQVESAVGNFDQTLGEIVRVRQLQLSLNEQIFYLRGVIDGDDAAVEKYFSVRDNCLTSLRQTARYAQFAGRAAQSDDLLRLTGELEQASDDCLRQVKDGHTDKARSILVNTIQNKVALALSTHINGISRQLETDRMAAVNKLGATSRQVLVFTLTIGALGVLLVLIGAMLIRRWLIAPMGELAMAADHYRHGDLAFRVRSGTDDELGRLGQALNDMAGSVAKANATLRDSETKYRSLFRNLRDAVVICDIDTRVVEFYEGDAEALTIEGGEYLGKELLEVWPEWQAATPDWSGVITTAIVHGRRFRASDVSVTTPRGTDTDTVLDFMVYRVDVGPERLAAILVRDVSDRHRLQHKLRQAETMEAVGTLAGGLAHDFNNLLASVTGTLSLMATEVANPAHAERIRTVLKTCWQASALSRKLLNFATSAHGNPQVFAMSETVRTMLDSFDPSFFEGVELHKDLADDVVVRMDQDQFTQIVLNLLRNARDAMQGGGTLTISVSQVTDRHPDDPSRTEPFGLLVVEDTGTGMPPDVQRRIFEPLFTTKSRASGRGRGLGLSVAYSSVKNAGGFIRVESATGRGTTFRVFLPLGNPPLHAVESEEPTRSARAYQASALLVDTDPLVVETWSEVLNQWGYEVVSGDTVREATIAAGQAAYPLKLAVVDVGFDEDRGVHLVEELVREFPGLRVVLTTGTVRRPVPAPLEPFVADQLTKPFTMEALQAAVRTGDPAPRGRE